MKTSVYVGTSLDGFIARKNDDIDWLTQFANEEAGQAFGEFMARIDAIVMGRGTFEKVLTFPEWPYNKHVFLLSTSIKQVPDDLKAKVTILSLKPKDVISELSRRGISTVYVDGGKVIQEFLKETLIDELTISRVPVLIGSGIPLFDHLNSDINFVHIRTVVASNGLVRSYYERKVPEL
jgi:dihydrofolate reductase